MYPWGEPVRQCVEFLSDEFGRVGYIPPDSVMVDIETVGVDIGSPVIQIGACRMCSTWNGVERVGEPFSICLQFPPDERLPPEGVQWWAKTDSELYAAIRAAGVPPEEAVARWLAWLPADAALWAWPARFDLMHLAELLRAFHVEHPAFNWSRCLDCERWLTAMRGDRFTEQEFRDSHRKRPAYPGRVHDAAYDVVWQIECLDRCRTMCGPFGKRKPGKYEGRLPWPLRV